MLILKLLIIIYILYTIRYITNILQYNSTASIITIHIPNKDKITNELKLKQPLHILFPENKLNITIHTMNKIIPGYIIKDNDSLISLDQLSKSDTIHIYKNKFIINDYNLINHVSDTYDYFNSPFNCGKSSYISLYRGNQSIPLTKNYKEHLLFQPLYGNVTFYLFNPKHETDIKGVESIKKWAIKIEIKQDHVLFIPPEWLYLYECSDEWILSQTEYDTYFSYIFNYIRQK